MCEVRAELGPEHVEVVDPAGMDVDLTVVG
jgi:hypothetical protein